MTSLGTSGRGDGQYTHVGGMCVDHKQQLLYVLDARRIHVYQLSYGTTSDTPTPAVVWTRKIAQGIISEQPFSDMCLCTTDGLLYVADYLANQVHPPPPPLEAHLTPDYVTYRFW